MSKIVLEDFNEGDGYYKVNLAYLNKEQVEEIEALVSRWKPTDEDIKNCIIMCLTDANEQRFKDYGTNLKDCLTWLEKQSKQKSVNKVEPKKFKVGDWIIFSENHNSIYQIERIDNYRYYLRHYLGGTLSVHFDNELIRLWTIKDAKDGDVLVTNSNIIFIFKFLDEGGTIAFRTSCTKNNGVYFPRLKERLCDQDVYPATKEQRDLLFKKMHEEGYEWDEDKKELKKIEKQGEQKPTLPKWKYKKDHTPLLRDSLILNKYGCVAKSPSGAIVSDVWVIDYDELAKLPKEEFEKQIKNPQVDGFDAELNALLKKYEHLSKKELQEPLEFYLGVVRDDLDVVRENPNHHEGWINIYKNLSIDIYETDGLVYESEEMALEARHDYDIATIKIEWEEQQ